ncbi:MAG TPA: DUF1178 family protein [Acetobacteraceae bacterium]|jgi:hypothetical protein|nr:DUF1178 family protein [Acetobacteraceae bacterium]
MIHYNVRCQHGHEFDGWFKDSTSFDKLAKRGLVECPTCGDTKVARALMAPAVATRDVALRQEILPPVPPRAAPTQQMAMTGGPVPAQMRAVLQRIRAEVEKNCDYVGPAFAEEARKIHHGESEQRGIYGETTAEQADALKEEGIEFSRIPWVPRADA